MKGENLVNSEIINKIINEMNPKKGISDAISLAFTLDLKTMYGERVVLTGDLPELGSWDPEKGIQFGHYGNVMSQTNNINLVRCVSWLFRFQN